MKKPARLLALAALSLIAQPAMAQVIYDIVSIPAEDVELQAAVFRPPGIGPFPAVVALHGCGGLFNSAGAPSVRHADWGQRLAAQGFIVVMPDSFRSRGLGSQCGVSNRSVRPGRERVADVQAARRWLQGRNDVKVSAISLMGWSNGGSTVLAAARADRKPGDNGQDFAKAVAFYPGCRIQAESGTFRARIPLLILMGEADDWTPPAPCIALTKAAVERGEDVSIKIYPDAFHDFDHPERAPTLRSGLAFTGSESGKAMTGTNTTARNDALVRVPAFLAR